MLSYDIWFLQDIIKYLFALLVKDLNCETSKNIMISIGGHFAHTGIACNLVSQTINKVSSQNALTLFDLRIFFW